MKAIITESHPMYRTPELRDAVWDVTDECNGAVILQRRDETDNVIEQLFANPTEWVEIREGS